MHSAYDAVGMHVDMDGILDLVVGASDLGASAGMKVYLGTVPPIGPAVFADGFELGSTGCWVSTAP
jgi:hypothetical protein